MFTINKKFFIACTACALLSCSLTSWAQGEPEGVREAEYLLAARDGQGCFGEQARLLSRSGLQGDVVASSPVEEGNFLALLRQDKGYKLAFYCKELDVAGYVRHKDSDYADPYKYRAFLEADQLRADCSMERGPMMFWLEVPHDVHNKDAHLGKWEGSLHVIPFYAFYTIEAGRHIKLGDIFSASYEYPSHYHDRPSEERTRQLAAAAFGPALLLADDMRASGFNPANLTASGKADPATSATAGTGFTVTIYSNSYTQGYKALDSRAPQVLNTAPNLQDIRFVCDSDGVEISLEKGTFDINSRKFTPQEKIFTIKSVKNQVYQMKAFIGETVPYYRLTARKGEKSGYWFVLPDFKGENDGVFYIKK
ncbi:MAG: hypothetical protein K6A35_06730 [bacterium]|nr:hypothetical protein [bacterium]